MIEEERREKERRKKKKKKERKKEERRKKERKKDETFIPILFKIPHALPFPSRLAHLFWMIAPLH